MYRYYLYICIDNTKFKVKMLENYEKRSLKMVLEPLRIENYKDVISILTEITNEKKSISGEEKKEVIKVLKSIELKLSKMKTT